MAAYDRPLAGFCELGDRYHEALVRMTASFLQALAGDFRNAVKGGEQAVAIFREIGDRRTEAVARSNLAGAYDVTGQVAQARVHYEGALMIAREFGQTAQEALRENNLGWLETSAANWQAALDRYRPALAKFRKLGDRRREALVLNNLGVVYGGLGQWDEAVRLYESALAIRRATGDQAGAATTLTALGRAHAALRRTGEALGAYRQALEMIALSKDRRAETGVRLLLGELHLQERRIAEGREAFGRALELAREVEDRRAEARALVGQAKLELLAGDAASARSLAAQAVPLLESAGARVYLAAALETVSRALAKEGRLGEAQAAVERALLLIEGSRGSAEFQDRAAYLATTQETFAYYAGLLVRSGQHERALEASERARARSLVEMLRESGAGIRSGADPVLLAREREILESLNAKGERLLPLMGRDSPRKTALESEIQDLESTLAGIQSQIRRQSPRYASLTMPSPVTANQIRESLLDDSTVLLEYALGDERSYLWICSRGGLQTVELPPRARIEEAANNAMRRVTPRAGDELTAALSNLSEMVLVPAAPYLRSKRLAIVPDGALQRTAFAMLPLAGEPLIARHEVVILPSATALAVLREESANRPAPARGLALFADPVFDAADPRVRTRNPAVAAAAQPAERILEHSAGSSEAAPLRIPRLVYSREEGDAIFRLAPPQSVRVAGFAANRTAATSPEIGSYRFLHFATHGYLDTANPGLSALVLSLVGEDGRPTAGFLRATDIYNMRLSADLVVLSACQTALGKEIRGEGVMGLTRAFFYAGVPRAVVSSWNVDDRATARLMPDFYRRMLRDGLRPSAALRQAQLELRKDPRWSSPYYWAAFAQHGDWK